MAVFLETDPALTLTEIGKIENELGICLPDDLRAHYLTHNGGRPHPRFYEKSGEWYGVHYFLPMGPSGNNKEFESVYRTLVQMTPEFPRDFIPFAVDAFGDTYLYSVSKTEYGKIFINRHEYYDDPERYVIFIADSLSAFITGLSDPPD